MTTSPIRLSIEYSTDLETWTRVEDPDCEWPNNAEGRGLANHNLNARLMEQERDHRRNAADPAHPWVETHWRLTSFRKA
jgi:hypothetical protein